MELTVKELLEHIKKNGTTLAKTTEDFIDIPSGRKLWFGIECNEDVISSYDRNTDDKNDYFNYDFDYQWSNIWHNDYKGKFIINELAIVSREEKMAESKEFIVNCLTEKHRIDVQKKMFSEGYSWEDGEQDIFDIEVSPSCISILAEDSYTMKYCDKPWCQEHCLNVKIISADEYLGEKVWGEVYSKVPEDEQSIRKIEEKFRQYGHYHIGGDFAFPEFKQDNKPKVKIMQTLTNTLKKILPGDIQKQYRASFRNGNLALTEYGERELLELLADKFKKELTDRAIEVIKEEEKK